MKMRGAGGGELFQDLGRIYKLTFKSLIANDGLEYIAFSESSVRMEKIIDIQHCITK